ncbi:MAG: 1-deoxy-D-xylulose-5-phosphate synthase [Betaproteobacteria bacterium]|nr:1-deoxy-D-xylulose-5-phosphate synthase [Betaproteobacteria bacterium]MBU6512040.1 1-deoxy-D-xylulose-5-phosphate synthase [Betaproteobacteria bacterium]MDE1954799.1 1-deoxy-D-xylulose-5-phosphate synthase [Betaproteobacteria bacterium]MDE2152229.1 1-deoxy-D-xylulose-5-phosphate synthase [Betaproteobacteria bacterium]MDE2478355.1 1-deoxy-D-xylulose-5-phosphate synthase [Betaproteobacteria bacterium]
MNLLDGIDDPRDLRRLPPEQLPALARELRQFLLETVARTGGHLSSNLGTVELTLALHYVFDTPHDRLVWDVGHQTYAHKILTGRRERMGTLRQWGGLSGFPRRDESPYDTFGTAHSSTSISAALGQALAARAKGERRKVVAVIGDGAMTGGMAFEALNNAGVHPEADLLIVLNDNDMSISAPVGALNRYLARLLSGRFYASARDAAKQVLKAAPPPLLALARRLEEQAKGLVAPGTLFEEFGVEYFGPIDGHDLHALVPTLQNLRERGGPRLLHVVTRKGYGYKLAEADPIKYHGPGRFDPAVGIKPPAVAPRPTFAQVFGHWLCDMAQADSRLMAVTPAMCEGSGMVEYAARFAQRYFDVGIAEQHAVTFAAGLACEGMRPVVAIYSTFLQRAYDQVIHDVALQKLPVVFAIDRAGIVGADGATHTGAYDIAALRCLPGMVLMAPSDELECRRMLSTAFALDGPSAVRYPRGAGIGAEVDRSDLSTLPVGRAQLRRQGRAPAGRRLALLAFGPVLHAALKVAEELDATVVDMRFIKPLDQDMLQRIAAGHDAVVTVEEGAVLGGAGSACLEELQRLGWQLPVLNLGLPDTWLEHGDPAQVAAAAGLDAAGLLRSIRERFGPLLGQADTPRREAANS